MTSRMDWGLGRYEDTARALEPASARVVDLARLVPGERVLDIGYGTGNAALCAARAGAETVGLDPAARLIEVARERAAAEGAEIDFVVGQAESLPFDDASFDVVLSVFGVIFTADPERAIREMLRVLRPDGRALLSAWLPTGTIATLMGVFGRAMAAATGSAPQRFAWHERDAVAEVAGRYGASVDAYDGEIQFSGESPEAYFAAEEQNHPMSVASRPLLEGAGLYDEVRREGVAVLLDGNQDPTGFRVTSPYRVLELRPQ
jgi:SAM-dependent methyltransferase